MVGLVYRTRMGDGTLFSIPGKRIEDSHSWNWRQYTYEEAGSDKKPYFFARFTKGEGLRQGGPFVGKYKQDQS